MTTPDNARTDPTGDPQDPRPMLSRALDQTGALVTSTDVADGALPTPCSEYDVATLIAHLQAVVRRLGVVIAGEPYDSVPQIWESDAWAVATGRREMLDDDVAAAAFPPAAVQIPAEPRGGAIPFAPVVAVPEDAPPYERLAGWFGRDPAWE